MDVYVTVIIGSTLFMTASTLIYEYGIKDLQSQACCNGTLGYPANKPRMPCSAMKCCNNTEKVVVYPVNHALGYVFKCVPKYEIKTQCYPNGIPVVSSNDTDVLYEARTCCEGHKFEVLYHNNEYNAALVIHCTKR